MGRRGVWVADVAALSSSQPSDRTGGPAYQLLCRVPASCRVTNVSAHEIVVHLRAQHVVRRRDRYRTPLGVRLRESTPNGGLALVQATLSQSAIALASTAPNVLGRTCSGGLKGRGS